MKIIGTKSNKNRFQAPSPAQVPGTRLRAAAAAALRQTRSSAGHLRRPRQLAPTAHVKRTVSTISFLDDEILSML